MTSYLGRKTLFSRILCRPGSHQVQFCSSALHTCRTSCHLCTHRNVFNILCTAASSYQSNLSLDTWHILVYYSLWLSLPRCTSSRCLHPCMNCKTWDTPCTTVSFPRRKFLQCTCTLRLQGQRISLLCKRRTSLSCLNLRRCRTFCNSLLSHNASNLCCSFSTFLSRCQRMFCSDKQNTTFYRIRESFLFCIHRKLLHLNRPCS